MSAPLYKRYVPPKPAVPVAAVPIPEPQERTNSNSNPDEEKKRKRERSEEEVAQRKAKKLKKKDAEISSQPAPKTSPLQATELPETNVQQEQSTVSESALSDAGLKSEFAHVKNTKKRHKLEKEARKQKKAAEKESQLNGDPQEAGDENMEAVVMHEPINGNEVLYNVDNGDTVMKYAGQEVAEISNDAEAQKEYDHMKSQPKKRRHKLEAALEQSADDDGAEEDDNEHLKKHSSIIGKFQKAQEISSTMEVDPMDESTESGEQPVLHDLVPLPQPEKLPTPEFIPEYSDLPPWLAQPMIVPSDSKTSFASLGLDADATKRLAENGFTEALPVQNAVIPLLLPLGAPGAKYFPGTQDALPDLAVSAATGSGKTIAYLLPIVESLRQNQRSGFLRALIVVPTRELVHQVAKTAESLTKDLNLKVGTSTGIGKFKEEQEKLVKMSYQQDAESYTELMAKLHRQDYPPEPGTDEYNTYIEELESQSTKEDQRLNDALSGPVNHVPLYRSRLDILVCTPGRLLEHMSSTLGFSLAHLEWLILDEADKLLDQQYDGFLKTLNDSLERERTPDEQDGREVFLRSRDLWNEQQERRVRKVVLSATMTHDISKLVGLQLRRPKLLVVRGDETDGDQSGVASKATNSGNVYELPRMLMEYCIPVGDGAEKPLTLVELLDSKILPANLISKKISEKTQSADASVDSDSDVSSVLSDSSSDLSSSESSDSDSSSVSDDGESSASSESDAEENETTGMHPARAALLGNGSQAHQRSTEIPTVLIFTSSNEAATRLFHLLKALRPQWTPFLASLTKNQAKKARRRNDAADKPSITIATDRAGRGLDTIADGRVITHVVQYDVPRSVTSYVHRVGRTARAGRKGDAWTLYTHSEARWFLREVARASDVRRVNEVEKVKVDVHDDSLRDRYQEALAGMREEVYGKQDA